MKKLFFMLMMFSLFSSFALAAPPVVDFNFFPATPLVFEPITFDPIITANGDLNILFWGFAGDGNINYYRTAFTDINSVVIADNWNDMDLTGWTVNGGTWSAATGQLVGGSCGGCTIYANAFVGPNSEVRISYKERRDADNVQGQFKFFTSGIASNADGYDLYFDDGGATGNVAIRKWVGGMLTTLATYTNAQTTGVMHDVNINVTVDGNISVYIDNVLKGTVNDTTYNSGNKVLFSTGNSAASNHTWDDLNVLTVISSSTPIDADRNENWTFTTPGNKNVCLTAGNSDGNTTACHIVPVTGNLAIQVFDENTHLPVPFPRADFLGSTTIGSSTGVLILSTPVVSGDYVVPIYATNYPPRYFTLNIDINSTLSFSVYLLDANKGKNIEFLIRDINSVKYNDDYFRIMKDGNVVTSIYTNSEAITLPIWLASPATDYNFFVDENSTSGTNIFSYGDTNLIIKIPINEQTLEPVTPYGILMQDITSIDVNNLTTDKSFKIYPNTYHPYAITIDANALQYFPRYYTVRTLGGDTNETLQPYLLRLIDGAVNAQMIVKDSLTSLSLQYYRFEFYTDVGGLPNVLVESPQVDSAGTFLFTTITGRNYFIKIYSPAGDLLKQGIFVSSTNTLYYLDISTGAILGTEPTTGVVDVNLTYPTNNFFFLNDSNNFGLQFIVNSTGPRILSVNVSVSTSGTIINQQTFTPTFPAVVWPSGTQFDSNFTTSLNNINTQVTITVETTQGNVIKQYMFPLKQDLNPTVTLPGFSQFCSSVGQLGCSLIWLFIGLMISIGLRFNPIFGVDNNAMFWVMAIWTGIAAFIGLVPYMIGFIAIIAGASFWAIRNRPIG